MADTEDEANRSVERVRLHDPQLEEHPAPLHLEEVRLIRLSGQADLDGVLRLENVYPNFKIVQMTHGRVLPINYPEALVGPSPPLTGPNKPSDAPHAHVLVLDASLEMPSPLEPRERVVGARRDFASAATPVPAARIHGEFVAGIIHLLEPRAQVRVVGLDDLNDDEFVSDFELATQLWREVMREDEPTPDVVNLSLGALTPGNDAPKALEKVISKLSSEHIQIFAAAGNDNRADLVYPAAFDAVHAVGAQRKDPEVGPTWWSNGKGNDETRFWAPGHAVVSTTPVRDGFDFRPLAHPATPANAKGQTRSSDLTRGKEKNVMLHGFAKWDGTSFATPIVVAAFAKQLCELRTTAPGTTAAGAWSEFDASGLFKGPDNTDGFRQDGEYAAYPWKTQSGSTDQGSLQSS